MGTTRYDTWAMRLNEAIRSRQGPRGVHPGALATATTKELLLAFAEEAAAIVGAIGRNIDGVQVDGNQRLAANSIAHLEHSEDTRHQRTINIFRIFKRTSIWYTYKVSVVLRDGTTKTLLSDLENVDQALYVKQELERFLRLEDREVEEYREPVKKVYQTQIKTEIRDNELHVFIKKFHWAFLGGAFIFAPFAGIMVWATIHTFEKEDWPISIIAILVSLGLLLLVYFFIATCVDTHHIRANPEELTYTPGHSLFLVATNVSLQTA